MISRIAPTPSGFLHLGNAFNFILTWLMTRHAGGLLRLRIDDGDANRARPEYLLDIFETLDWLGLDWDEGPRSAEDHTTHFSQSLRAKRYGEILQRIIVAQEIFACDCSRKNIATQNSEGNYPGTCRDKGLPFDAPDTTLRLRTREDLFIDFKDGLLGDVKICPHDATRDPIVRRRDGLPAYHLASLTDDLDYGVTHIVRGADLLQSTVVQLYLSQVIGSPVFAAAQFIHHPLLTNGVGGKLSKSASSYSLHAMRVEGLSAEEVFRRFSGWMSWPRTVRDGREALAAFAEFGIRGLR